MPSNNPGFDWKCKNEDNKGRCLTYRLGKSPDCQFDIRYNNIADWFILSAWDNRDSLNPLHVWIFHKNDIIRGREFWKRYSFTITITSERLKEFEEYEITDRLEKLKEIINRLKDINEF